MKHTAFRLFAVFALVSACRPLVVDQNGWPIGFARNAPAKAEKARSRPGQADPYAGVDPHAPAVASTGDTPPSTAVPEGPLVGWNGDVVQGDDMPTQEPPRHDLEPDGSGRMRIIELYQSVLDERDSLRDELETVNASLDAAKRHTVELEEQTRTQQQRIVELETAQQSMTAENIDLAARLTTAQIRRLEAEKLLLETRIGDLRAKQPAEASETPENGS